MRNSGDHPSRLSEEEIFVIFDVIDKRGSPAEAREKIYKKLHLRRPHRKTVTDVFNVGIELFRRDPSAVNVLTTEEADEIAEKAAYGVSRSRVVELHRLYQLWDARRREQTDEKRPEKEAEEMANKFKNQLFTPPPEAVLIDDLGTLGDNTAWLRQDILNVILQNLGYTAGLKVTSTAATWGARETEIFWRVLPSGSVERYCPIERDPAFQRWLASPPSGLKQDFASWKRLGGSYLAQCKDTRMEIYESARRRTPAGLIENLILALPRLSQPPPQPMTVNFGNLVYRLAIEYCRSSGARGLPHESSYHTTPGDPPIFVKLVLGQARIHLATTLPGVAQTWAALHREMIVEWGQSKEIGMLLQLFRQLEGTEENIKKAVDRVVSGH